jgi:hypothetical protein
VTVLKLTSNTAFFASETQKTKKQKTFFKTFRLQVTKPSINESEGAERYQNRGQTKNELKTTTKNNITCQQIFQLVRSLLPNYVGTKELVNLRFK